MRELFKKTVKNITFNLSNIVIFELFYRLVTSGIFLGLLSRGLDFTLKKAGYSYLTGRNILNFLFRPYTLLAAVCLVLILTIITAIEISSLLTAYQASMNRIKVYPIKMLYGGIKKFSMMFHSGWRKLPFLILSISFFMTLPIFYLMMLRIRPVSFVFEELAKNTLASAGVWLALFLLLLSILPNLLVIEACFLERLTLREGKRKSRRIMKKNLWRILFLFLAVNLLMGIGLYLIYLLFALGTAVMVVLTAQRNLSLAVMTRACDIIELAVISAGTVVSLVVNHACFTGVYYEYTGLSTAREDFDLYLPDESKIGKKMIAWVSVICFALYGLFVFNTVRSGSLLAKKAIFETQITAHRGSSVSAPENTLEAIEKAIEELADYAEIDLQLTQDGEVVLLHDNSLKRTTGRNIYVWNIPFDELQELDASYGFGAGYENVRVPKFEDILALCKGKINLNVEMKANKANQGLPQKALELIGEYGMESQCVITCTSLNMLIQVKEINPEIKTGYILAAAYGNYYDHDAVDFISIRSNFVTESVIENAHSYGKEVHAWTVNSKMEMERLKLLGVDNIITDRPVFAREVLFREGTPGSLLTYIKMIFK